MTTFYYVAVSTSARRKMTGKIESASEKDARTELNKMGLAILNLTTEKPADFEEADIAEDTTFEFVAKDKFMKVVSGTIDAADREAAYDRLVSEFHFDVDAVYSVNASPEEKQKAIAEGIQPILEMKAKSKVDEEGARKRTLRGGLQSLVKMAEGKRKEDCMIEVQKVAEAKLEAAPINLAEKSSDAVTAQTAVPSKPQEEIPTTVLEESSPQPKEESITPVVAPKEKPIKLISKSLEEGILQSKKFFDKFYFRLTELVVPQAGKTRAEAWRDIIQLFSGSSEVTSQEPKHKFSFSDPMDRKAFFQRLWMLAEDVTGILAFIYFTYLILGNFALRYEWGAFSDLAAKTLEGNTVIPFLAFTFIFIRFLMWLREKLTSWSSLRTSLLFVSGAIFLIFMGLNLMH